MTQAHEAYPLQWPAHRKRTSRYNAERAKFEVTFARARDNIVHEVQLLVGRYREPHLVISTNSALRRDRLPLAGQKAPDDAGVAIYFLYKERQMAFACDRWEKIEHNMQAIAKTIEALRGIDRWGTGDMLEAAFAGFTELPSAASTTRPWHEVLGVPAHISTIDVKDAYRRLASQHHPDKVGGSTTRMAEINIAWAEFQKERGL